MRGVCSTRRARGHPRDLRRGCADCLLGTTAGADCVGARCRERPRPAGAGGIVPASGRQDGAGVVVVGRVHRGFSAPVAPLPLMWDELRGVGGFVACPSEADAWHVLENRRWWGWEGKRGVGRGRTREAWYATALGWWWRRYAGERAVRGPWRRCTRRDWELAAMTREERTAAEGAAASLDAGCAGDAGAGEPGGGGQWRWPPVSRRWRGAGRGLARRRWGGGNEGFDGSSAASGRVCSRQRATRVGRGVPVRRDAQAWGAWSARPLAPRRRRFTDRAGLGREH